MPTATLKELNRLNIGGTEMYHRGVPREVDVQTALRLAQDPRFDVAGLTTRDLVEHQQMQSRPVDADLNAAIVDAIDALDVDDDANFDRSGRASVAAISGVLGYPITVEERDAATATPRVKLEAADEKPVGPAARAKIKVPQPAAAAPAERSVAMGG